MLGCSANLAVALYTVCASVSLKYSENSIYNIFNSLTLVVRYIGFCYVFVFPVSRSTSQCLGPFVSRQQRVHVQTSTVDLQPSSLKHSNQVRNFLNEFSKKKTEIQRNEQRIKQINLKQKKRKRRIGDSENLLN